MLKYHPSELFIYKLEIKMINQDYTLVVIQELKIAIFL